MKYRIEFSKAAIRDLDRMWAEVFEASRSNDTSNQYITDLLDFTEKRSIFPKAGNPLYYENSFTGYYYIIFKAYIIFYRLEEEKMLIDRVLFGKSDYIRQLKIFQN